MDEIILEELEFVNISIEDVTRKMKDRFKEEVLIGLASESGIQLSALREMPWIAFIKVDIAGKNIQGYRKYRQKIKDADHDV